MARLHLLGPVELEGAEGRVHLGGSKERAVLALLALRPGEAISEDRLVDALWGDEPPRTATKTLRSYVSRLRRAIAESGGGGALAIETTPGGYRLHAADDVVDVVRVSHLVTQARQSTAGGDAAAAAGHLAEALRAWRGQPLGELADEPWAVADAARLAELRIDVLEEWVEAELACGRETALVGELETICAAHPFRERLWGQRIVALYRSGRQTDALRVYQELRTTLADELGIHPSPELQALEQAVLRHDPELARPAERRGESVDSAVAPLTLPPALLVGRRHRFVGRDRELELLRHSWEEAVAGSWRAVFVSGEPGIGKSRLVSELASELHAAGATVLLGTCDEDLRVPYQPLVEALRVLVAACPVSLLRDHVRRYGGELVRLVPELANRVPESPAPLQSEPESERYRLFEATVGLLGAAAERQPVLLVLDDLQWATKPTLLLLRHLSRAAESTPLLIVGLYRHTELSADLAEVLADLRRTTQVERLALGGLDDGGVIALLEALSESALDDAGRAFARRLRDETGGSPFFVREVVRHLLETGAIREDQDGWTSDVPGPAVDLPVSVREVIGRRLGRLSDPARRLLTVASVVGHSFSLRVLQEVEREEGDSLLDALDEATAAGIIREGTDGAGSYAFSHALLRHALYEDLSALRRSRLHRRVAEALEALPGSGEARVPELATHYLAAAADGVADKAVEYAAAAARQAAARVAYEEAVRFCEQALDVLQWAGLGESGEACDLVLAMADSQWRAGDMVPSRETYDTAAGMARRLGDARRLAAAALRNNVDLSGPARSARADPAVIARLEEALEALGPEDSETRARVLARLAIELFYSSDIDRRTALSDESVAMAERLGDPHVLLFARNCREWATLGTDLELRLTRATEVLRLAEELGDREVAYQTRYLRNLVFLEAGDFAAADAEAEEGQRLADELRLPAILPWVASYWSLRAWVSGRITEAEALNQQGLSQALTRPLDPELVFAHFGGQAFIYQYLRPELVNVVPVVEEMAAQEGAPAAFAYARGLAYSLAGRNDDAGAALDDVLARGLHETPKDALWLSNVPMLGLICRTVRDRPGAAALLYEELEPYADRWIAAPVVTWGPMARVLGVLAGVLGRFDVAERHLLAALDSARRVPAPIFEADIAYDLAVVLLERDGADDRRRADALLHSTIETADTLGLTVLRTWAEEARSRV